MNFKYQVTVIIKFPDYRLPGEPKNVFFFSGIESEIDFAYFQNFTISESETSNFGRLLLAFYTYLAELFIFSLSGSLKNSIRNPYRSQHILMLSGAGRWSQQNCKSGFEAICFIAWRLTLIKPGRHIVVTIAKHVYLK